MRLYTKEEVNELLDLQDKKQNLTFIFAMVLLVFGIISTSILYYEIDRTNRKMQMMSELIDENNEIQEENIKRLYEHLTGRQLKRREDI